MKRFFLFISAVLLFAATPGCDTPKTASGEAKPSDLPWSIPEKWEGASGIGSMMPQTH